MNRLSITDLKVSYGKTEVIKGVTAFFEEGITAVLGANGAGKTTLLKALATLLPMKKGSIKLNEYDKPRDLRRHLGYVPQNFGSYPYLTVEETLMHFAVLKDLGRKEAAHAAANAMERTNLSDAAGKKVGSISGGMMRRLGIAQALLTHPVLLLIDEPTAGLDPDECVRFRTLLRQLPGDTIVLFTTHIVQDISVSDRVCVMQKGKIREIGTPNDLAGLAQGHVRESLMPREEVKNFIENRIIVSESPRENGVLIRWLEERFSGQSPEACPEDGYIWLSRLYAKDE